VISCNFGKGKSEKNCGKWDCWWFNELSKN
jgi:hypothetical protein